MVSEWVACLDKRLVDGDTACCVRCANVGGSECMLLLLVWG